MKWDYLVENVYDDFSYVPSSVQPNRLMNSEEISAYLSNIGKVMKATAGRPPKLDTSSWTFQLFLQARGQEGWELIQATRLVHHALQTSTVDWNPAYWRVIFKRPTPPTVTAAPAG